MISIIIPAYNEEKYIAACLRSVSLLEKPTECEVIVVNNASTDRTPDIVKGVLSAAKVIQEPNKGLTRAYNRGAREARGDILVFVDADMVLFPNHLVKISRMFAEDKKLVALSGPYIYKDNGKFCEFLYRFIFLFLAMPSEIIFNRLLRVGTSLASGNSAIKKDAFEKTGGFNENLFYGLEPDLALRLSKAGKVRFKHCLGNVSSGRRFKKEGTFRMLFRYIINTIWPVFFKRPFTKDYFDIR